MTLFSKSPCLTGYLKINHETGYTESFLKKTNKRIEDHHNILSKALSGISYSESFASDQVK